MMRRVLALAMACLMLSGCGPVRTEPWDNEVAQTDGPEIAYVPLDDRPDNVERVVYLAESLGYTLSMPERDDYRTALDGQPCNENGTSLGIGGNSSGGCWTGRRRGVTAMCSPWTSSFRGGW